MKSPAKYFVAQSPAVKVYPDGREVCDPNRGTGKREYVNRRNAMVVRQGWICPLCLLSMTFEGDIITFDHERGRGSGGSHRDDRIEIDGRWINAAVHLHCNGQKGSKRYHWKDGLYVPVAGL